MTGAALFRTKSTTRKNLTFCLRYGKALENIDPFFSG